METLINKDSLTQIMKNMVNKICGHTSTIDHGGCVECLDCGDLDFYPYQEFDGGNAR